MNKKLEREREVKGKLTESGDVVCTACNLLLLLHQYLSLSLSLSLSSFYLSIAATSFKMEDFPTRKHMIKVLLLQKKLIKKCY